MTAQSRASVMATTAALFFVVAGVFARVTSAFIGVRKGGRGD